MKRIISFLIAIELMFSTVVFAQNIHLPSVTSMGACVLDFQTGEVLYEYNGNTPRVPASMTKIMNMYCVYEAIENGEISLDTVVPISQNVYNKSRNSLYQSVLPLYYNTTYTVDEMIDVIVTYSASGAAVAMAELLGGGNEAVFVERMNNKAKEMGIDAYYYDSCGIASNMVSPIAMATLARNIIKDYPDILVRSAKPYVNFHGNIYKTTNHLLDTYYYKGADGLKTGTTSAAGYCFCGTAVRNGRRMISVTMSSSSTSQRFIDTARLLDYGFAVAAQKYDSIYYTDMRTFINGALIPTFLYNGTDAKTVIIAEDLKDHGFDVAYNDTSRTLNITYKKDKKSSPLSFDSYADKNGEKAFSILNNTDINVVLDDGNDKHIFENVYVIDGYTLIAVSEFGKIYDSVWNDEKRATEIVTYYKEPQAVLPDGEKLTSESAYIMDYDTGEEIYSFDADTQRPVASIAKMMSVYVILDAIKNGEISLDTVVPISENVYNLSRVEDYKMMVNLEYDEVYTVDEIIDMIIIDSAAACVTAVAELISGSEQEFVKRMNIKAKEIGINSQFYNGTGVCLNPQTDKENLMSAKEVAVMTRRMIQDYPDITERTKCASVEFHGKTYYNLNKMFTDYYYEGADGFKNGMTTVSGYCMCGTAIRDGKRIITVTLPSDSNEARFTDTAKMFDYGFSQLGVSKDSDSNIPDNVIDYKSGDEIKINIDGNYLMQFNEQQPLIINDVTMIPIRDLMETLGKSVSWDEKKGEVTIYDDTTEVILTINSDKMLQTTKNLIDGTCTQKEVALEAAPVILNGRTCLPVRAVVEAFGAAVIWEADTKTIMIIAGVC